MPINTDELIQVLSSLADHRQMRVNVTESFKGGMIAGVGAFSGGVLLGPIGLAFGGICGSILASWLGTGKFKSVAHVILYDMTPVQQARLAESCMKIIQDLSIEDVALLLPLLLNTPSAQTAICQAMVTFFQNEMKCQIID